MGFLKTVSVILDLTTGGAKAKFPNCTHRCFKDTLYIVVCWQREGRKRLLAGKYCHNISGFKAFLKIGFAKECNFMNKTEFKHHSVKKKLHRVSLSYSTC